MAGLGDGKQNADYGTVSGRAVNAYLAAIQFAQLAGNAESEADAFGLGGEERVADPTQEFRRNAATRIPDLEGDLFAFGRRAQYHGSLGRGRLDGIQGEVEDDLLQMVRVGP